MTPTDLIPPAFRNNASARKIILDAYQKKQREGLYVGYHSERFAELVGIQPADDREYGEPSELQEQD